MLWIIAGILTMGAILGFLATLINRTAVAVKGLHEGGQAMYIGHSLEAINGSDLLKGTQVMITSLDSEITIVSDKKGRRWVVSTADLIALRDE